jgi:peptidylprolyl isomerase
MRTAQQGDRVQVHYVKHWQDGAVASSAGRPPVELTVGVDHPRLPGLGKSLVGLAPGEHRTLSVTAEEAYGPPDPSRRYRLARARFAGEKPLVVGKWLRITDRRGRRRLIRIVDVKDQVVVVDNNHPHAGQALKLDVELIAIHG